MSRRNIDLYFQAFGPVVWYSDNPLVEAVGFVGDPGSLIEVVVLEEVLDPPLVFTPYTPGPLLTSFLLHTVTFPHNLPSYRQQFR